MKAFDRFLAVAVALMFSLSSVIPASVIALLLALSNQSSTLAATSFHSPDVGTPVIAQLGESSLPPTMQPFRLINPGTNRPLKSKEKQTLEDIFRKVDLKATSGPPVDLTATKIPGLPDKAVVQLGMNYFVVMNGTPYRNISDIYAENRADCKPNFVTVDSVLHPYFAFSNGMIASAVEESVYKDLQQLLRAMVSSSIADYRRTDDEEVKDDVQRNLAYLYVALRILDPKAKLPDIGGAMTLVDADYALIDSGKRGRSQIFSVDQDFGTFRPWGFMAQRPKLRRFHVAYQWLSRMPFPLNNSSNNTFEGGGNSFRRAVLLYRSIVLANVGKESALERWNRIAMAVALINFDSNAKKKTIIPPELAPVLKTSESDLARLLHSLSQPFLRTKLLLSVRNQRPVELNARSVFEMDQAGGTAGDDVVFRLFPLIDPPELVWLREEGHDYVEPAEGPTRVPLGLINLHAHGAQQATNILSEQLDSLDIGLIKRVPRLERLVKVLTADDAASDRHWGIITTVYRPYPDTVQIGLRSELWLTKQLETAMAAWIDSYSACLVIPPAAVKTETTSGAASSTTEAGTSKSTSTGIGTGASSATDATFKMPTPSSGAVTRSNTAIFGTSSRSSDSAATAGTSSRSSQSGATGGTQSRSDSAKSGTSSPADTETFKMPVRSSTPQAPHRPTAPQPQSNDRPATTAVSPDAAAAKKVRPARFHYLEPRVEVYKNLQVDCQNLIKQLTQLGYMPERYLPRSQDFMRLLKRLTIISELEIKNEPISMPDFNLLANIDRVLQPVDCPLASYIYLDVSADSSGQNAVKTATTVVDDKASTTSLKSKEISTTPRTGATLGVGRAGKLYIVCSTSQGAMLTRGGCYTYYEIQGGPQRDEHWERKLTYGLVLPPYWTRKFSIVQEETKNRNIHIIEDKSQSGSAASQQL